MTDLCVKYQLHPKYLVYLDNLHLSFNNLLFQTSIVRIIFEKCFITYRIATRIHYQGNAENTANIHETPYWNPTHRETALHRGKLHHNKSHRFHKTLQVEQLPCN